MELQYTGKNIAKNFGQPYLLKKILTLLWSISDEKNWWYDISSVGVVICHISLNELLMVSISVDVVVWMKLVLLNGEYSITEEFHNNDVG